MAEHDEQDKTEEPTAQKLKKAKEEGNVPKSQEVGSVLLMLAAMLVVIGTGSMIYNQFQDLFTSLYVNLDQPIENRDGAIDILNSTLLKGFYIIGPLLLVLTAVAVFSNIVQTGVVLAPKTLEAKASRISPLKGFKKIFSIQGVAELVKGVSKVFIVGIIIYYTVKGETELFSIMLIMPVTETLAEAGRLLVTMMTRILSALIVLAIADSIYTRFKHKKDLRMTKKEVRDEMKQSEGDPHMKSKRKEKAMSFSRQKRLDHAVLSSDVVITNPTHYSVALQYNPEQNLAPVVKAKGMRLRALKIREHAKTYDVPIVENPPIARALFASTAEDEIVPEEHFQIIAEILAYVYQLKEEKQVYGS